MNCFRAMSTATAGDGNDVAIEITIGLRKTRSVATVTQQTKEKNFYQFDARTKRLMAHNVSETSL